jgi:hypothetical protein
LAAKKSSQHFLSFCSLGLKPAPCSQEKSRDDSPRQDPRRAVHGREIIGRAIRHKRLQALQQHRECHKYSPDEEWPRPSEAAHRCDYKVAREVVEFPAQSRPWLPSCRAHPTNARIANVAMQKIFRMVLLFTVFIPLLIRALPRLGAL